MGQRYIKNLKKAKRTFHFISSAAFLCTFATRNESKMSQLSHQMPLRLIGVNALLHFLVDGLCICCLYLTTADCEEMMTIYVTYNVLAFLTQPLTGWWADRMRQKHWMLLGAVLLLTLGVMTASIRMLFETPNIVQALLLIMSLLLGMGNSLFHVWGGKQTAIRTENDIRALGMFVSTGAFGLAIGGVFASWLLLYVFLLGIGVLAIAALKFAQGEAPYDKVFPADVKLWNGVWFIIVLIMFIVAGRAYVGDIFSCNIPRTTTLILMLGAVSMLGKMAGGWLVKGLGMWKAVLLMVVGIIVCFMVMGKEMHVSVILAGLFFVNCTMPVTLYWANALLRGKEGLAFGLLAAALIPWHRFFMTAQSIVLILTALIFTILIEYGVLWMLKERRKKVLLSSIAINVLTNVPLNLYLHFIDGRNVNILIGEVVIFLIEAVWYWFFTRNIKQAVIYSFLCNAISFLIGILSVILFFAFSIFTSYHLYGDYL